MTNESKDDDLVSVFVSNDDNGNKLRLKTRSVGRKVVNLSSKKTDKGVAISGTIGSTNVAIEQSGAHSETEISVENVSKLKGVRSQRGNSVTIVQSGSGNKVAIHQK